MLGLIFQSFYVAVDFSEYVCGHGLFPCQRGSCIDSYRRCDGYDDCGDGSDEKNCSGKEVFHFPIFCNVYLMFKRKSYMIDTVRVIKPD